MATKTRTSKLTSTLRCILITFLFGHSVNAVPTYFNDISDTTDFTWNEAFEFAYLFGQAGPVTVNGLEFVNGDSFASFGASFPTAVTVTPTAFGNLLGSGVYHGPGGGPITFSHSGLTIGYTYEVQLFFAHFMTEPVHVNKAKLFQEISPCKIFTLL